MPITYRWSSNSRPLTQTLKACRLHTIGHKAGQGVYVGPLASHVADGVDGVYRISRISVAALSRAALAACNRCNWMAGVQLR